MDGDLFLPPQSFTPLSQREQEILALLSENLSDREIAARLVVALNTVKWYNRQIFNKLGVENRRQAVEQAFALSLLKSESSSIARHHNLPAQTTPFIGRSGELEKLNPLLTQGPSRLITLLAPGGMGKTRLALAAAEACLTHFVDGIYYVPLTALPSPSQVAPAIADALGFQLTSERRSPLQQLTNFLSNKHLLLVLDNFEHLLEGAVLLSNLLEAAPRLHILVTSRERLNLDCETLYAVWGMGYPESADIENARNYSAVQLFLECGRRFASQSELEDLASVIRVCQLTQGMPLALELAAAWLVALSPAEIAGEVAHSLDFLQTHMIDIPTRQRSIRAVFEASWQQLSVEERVIFQNLGVFRGGFTRQAAQAVAEAGARTLMALVNKALITRNPTRERYEVHELLRQYAEEQLRQSGNTAALRSRHAHYFANRLREHLPRLQGQDQPAALNSIEQDFDNIRDAVHYLLDQGEIDDFMPVAESLRLFFEARVHLSSAVHHPGLPYTSFRLFFEARAHFSGDATAFFSKALLAKAHSAAAEVSLHEGLGDALQVTGSYDQARQEFEQARLLLPSNALALRVRLLRKQALTLDAQNRLEEALRVLAEAEATLSQSNQPDQAWWQEWIALQNSRVSANFFLNRLQPIREQQEQLRAAVERYGTPAQRFDFYTAANAIELRETGFLVMEKAMEYAQLGMTAAVEAGSPLQIALAHIRVGLSYTAGDQWTASEHEFLVGLALSERVGNVLTQTICATFLAVSCRMRGQIEATERWAQLALKISSDIGIDLYRATAQANLAWVAWRTKDLPQAVSLAEEAQRIWQRASPAYPLRGLAYWVTLGVMLTEDRLHDAVQCAREILSPPQVMPREPLLRLLQDAIQTWDEQRVAECRACFSEIFIQAGATGYL